ncbi:unnamed protein product [Chironomus riparius]|uniref:Leucine-rich repeat containing protein n=1 Tax=Chironomus riparius TaxID=315576 RepID=A0A9N9S683_9DIPT|nr:unnamed protein product [Chironomus riparius]
MTLIIKDQPIQPNKVLVFNGQHNPNKTNQNIEGIYFINCKLSKVPQGITRVFPNLHMLLIRNTNLSKISRSDLFEYRNFKIFLFTGNEIEFLCENLFADCKNLTTISFCGNSLKVVLPSILDGLKNLKFVDFSGNPCYMGCYSKFPGKGHDTSLEELKTELEEKFEIFGKNPEFLQERNKVLENLIFKSNENVQKMSENGKTMKEKNEKLMKILEAKEAEMMSIKEQLDGSTKRILELEEKLVILKLNFHAEPPYTAYNTTKQSINLNDLSRNVNKEHHHYQQFCSSSVAKLIE